MDTQSAFVHRSLKDLVADDVRTISVLERYGLDYCCHGSQTLEQAAHRHGASLDEVVGALASLGDPAESGYPAEWEDLAALTRHIVEHHHGYVRGITPTIHRWLEKLVERHGTNHPELAGVRDAFEQLSGELSSHMAKEEGILFPYIDDLAAAGRTGGRLPRGPFGTILHPVRAMEAEHEHAEEVLHRLRQLTKGYLPPADGCTTFTLCYDELRRFEADLHRHVHLENNLLFPRALDLENRLS
jgi:regulator of cell morphogenesis and NO signaling